MDHQSGFKDETEIFKEEDGITVIQIRNKDGNGGGTMTYFEVMPGIMFAYNDFHMQSIQSEFIPEGEVFCVDHCIEGRIEQEISPGVFRYVGTKDIRLDNRRNHATNFYFPLSHYHGITIQFEIEKADESIKKVMPDFPTTIREIRDRYCGKDTCSYLRSEEYVEHIFHEMYHVETTIRKHYMKLKVLELLLCLWSLKKTELSEPTCYYAKNPIEKVKAVCELITSDLQTHYTVEELSNRFSISATTMKTTFKGIYGKPIYTFLQEKRMEKASVLLLNSEMSITDIATEVGYETPSKFSAAFKKAMNLTPLEFRKREN